VCTRLCSTICVYQQDIVYRVIDSVAVAITGGVNRAMSHELSRSDSFVAQSATQGQPCTPRPHHM
jgi:hypothetical protein